MKKQFIILIFIISILAISFSYSQEVIGTDSSSISTFTLGDSLTNDTVLNDPLLYASECCSVILQVGDENSVLSFRRDAPYNANIYIENHTVDNKQIMKQYKEANGYFVQVIITSDGYVVGIGGGSDGEKNAIIENQTYQMLNNTTSFENCDKYLDTIYGILSQSSQGHYVVKAPNGTYHIVFPDRILHGELKEGEYLSVPNEYSYFRTGTFSLDQDVMNQSINLAKTDFLGFERRDITTFNITFHDDKTHVDVYGSNDDGKGVNRDTAFACDDIYLANNTILGSDLPIAPNKVLLTSFDLEEQFSRTYLDIAEFFFIGF